MAYNTDNLKSKAPGKTQEESDGGSPGAGLYKHPETGAEIITMYDPLFGDAQSEGIVRLGFERVSDAPEGSIVTIVEQNMNPAARIYNSDTVVSDKARLDALELESLRREKSEREAAEANEAAAKKEAEKEEKTKTKVEAKASTEAKKESK